LYATLLAGATFIWGWAFYKKDYHPQPFKVLAQAIVGGALAMLPLLAYRYIYNNHLPALAEYEIFQPLIEHSIFSGIIFFAINLIILSVLLLIMTSLLSLLMTFFRHETLDNIKASIEGDELEFITVSMMIGLLIYVESILENIFNVPIVYTIFGSILFLTVIEEYVKHLIVRFIDDKKIKDIDDAITFSVMVGLSFAVIETIIYAIVIGDLSLLIYRAFLSLSIHVIASGIFGYYYGLAHFAKPITELEHKEKTYRINLKWIHKILTLNRSTVYKEEKMIEGLALATLFHGTANVLFELHLAFISVPFIIFGVVMLSYFYKESHLLYRLLHSKKKTQ
jgi:RsiW-degrading membrane proteinase PrsW (M82 family)